MSLLEAPPRVKPFRKHRLTLEEWDSLPEDPDGPRFEVCDGELVMAPPADLWHQSASLSLASLLRAVLPRGVLGTFQDTDVVLRANPLSLRRPDVLVVHIDPNWSRRHRLTATDGLLAVEILSPSNRPTDTIAKKQEYAEAGIPEYWIVDTDAPSLEVWRLGAGASYELVQTVTDRADLPVLGHTIPIDLQALTAL